MINVHSYESMGTFDGPGLRLVVFLQGCPFRCLYCANPDTIDVKGGTPTTPEEILQMAISQKAFFGRKEVLLSPAVSYPASRSADSFFQGAEGERHPYLSGQ